MCIAAELSRANIKWPEFREPKPNIEVQLAHAPISPQRVVQHLASIEGPVDIYSWYEGPQLLPRSGATFMKTKIFEPLYRAKQDVKLYLYSLKSWDFKKSVPNMPTSTRLGEAINQINKTTVECLYSSTFFQYCLQVENRDLYTFINEELPKKRWLFELSASYGEIGTTVSTLFQQHSSFFDCIQDVDVSSAYSYIQYVEGYYLIQRSVREGLAKEQKKIEIAFVLPNDEGKYYQDFPTDIEKMLLLDFGKDLAGIDIRISFLSFEYEKSLKARPYLSQQRQCPQVTPEEIRSYFNYLSQTPDSAEHTEIQRYVRDLIHNLNPWN